MGIQAKREQLNEGSREQAQEVQGPCPSNCSRKHWTTVVIQSMQIPGVPPRTFRTNKKAVKIGSCVGYYSVLLDTRYAGKFFNYGIEVNSYSILEVLGSGINGTFTLANRERKHADGVRGRVCIILKYLFIHHQRILERIGDKLAVIDL